MSTSKEKKKKSVKKKKSSRLNNVNTQQQKSVNGDPENKSAIEYCSEFESDSSDLLTLNSSDIKKARREDCETKRDILTKIIKTKKSFHYSNSGKKPQDIMNDQ